ncbi:hypothetical protein [Microbacterium sp. B35-30]|uniref:hypothetical protein n=1 Tax=Microbacterium sp. B35-30 TaxID=1962642 RepID=UPI0013D16A7E|nr:hypothetical protein [Microbacterium sp. B35-30]
MRSTPVTLFWQATIAAAVAGTAAGVTAPAVAARATTLAAKRTAVRALAMEHRHHRRILDGSHRRLLLEWHRQPGAE